MRNVFDELNRWTDRYNHDIRQGKWAEFFNWQPYHWFRSEKIDPPIATSEVIIQSEASPRPRFVPVEDALSAQGIAIDSEREGEIPIWMEALSPIQHFSKAAEDNVFCHVTTSAGDSFDAFATPINPNRSLEKLSNFLLEKSSTNGTNVSSENRFHQ